MAGPLVPAHTGRADSQENQFPWRLRFAHRKMVFMQPQRLVVPLFQRPYVSNEENQWAAAVG